MENNSFKFGEISRKISYIIDDTQKIVSKFDTEAVENFSKDIEEIKKQKLLTIAFIGQYNAGKSTIISALTGNKDISIAPGIVTDKTTDYNWNNVLLTDTPGICTDRQDHDDITYKKIKESDLLIYCLTNNLFDDIILNNFNKIAFSELQKNKIMIVINKMAGEKGGFDNLVANYKVSLNESLKPNNFDDFLSCFIEAEEYIEGIEEDDDELIEMSHFNDFVSTLNNFIESKGILAKVSTPIYKTISFIDNSILTLSSKDNKEFLILINRIEKEIELKKQTASNRISAAIRDLTSSIINCSNIIINKIGSSEEEFKLIEKELDNKIEVLITDAQNRIQKIIEEIYEDLNNNIDKQFSSDIGMYVIDSIEQNKINIDYKTISDFSALISGFKLTGNESKKIIPALQKFITKSNASKFLKIKDLTRGNEAVKLLKDVVHFFGGKFKPYQAIKIVKNINNILVILGPALSLLAVGADVFQLIQDEKKAKELEQTKQKCYSQFLDMSNKVENAFREEAKQCYKELFDTMLDKIKNIRTDMIAEEKSSNESVLRLKEYKKELENMLVLSEK